MPLMLDRALRAFCKLPAVTLKGWAGVVWPLNVRVKVPPVALKLIDWMALPLAPGVVVTSVANCVRFVGSTNASSVWLALARAPTKVTV